MYKEIIQLIVGLAIIAGAIFVPEYRDYLNPIVGLIVGYYFATRTQLLATTKSVLGMKKQCTYAAEVIPRKNLDNKV